MHLYPTRNVQPGHDRTEPTLNASLVKKAQLPKRRAFPSVLLAAPVPLPTTAWFVTSAWLALLLLVLAPRRVKYVLPAKYLMLQHPSVLNVLMALTPMEALVVSIAMREPSPILLLLLVYRVPVVRLHLPMVYLNVRPVAQAPLPPII